MDNVLKLIRKYKMYISLVALIGFLWLGFELKPFDMYHPMAVTSSCIQSLPVCNKVDWGSLFVLEIGVALWFLSKGLFKGSLHEIVSRFVPWDESSVQFLSLVDPMRISLRKGRLQPLFYS